MIAPIPLMSLKEQAILEHNYLIINLNRMRDVWIKKLEAAHAENEEVTP